uniref:Ycf1 protein n=1 Tax=Gravesia laxiflora TaxID=2494302 RepID=UPI002238C7B3|nr:Ycf1 protein [Gravesia laxiflora]YP_010553211.1 Ycf1 protein [Gravesia rosea]YP_010553306.1 Ycf1 protein [Gravesia subglobosa]UTM97255.1 Ycf1 protein [Gravesia laxiflora]UTM97350.1 Ycf1 protein [Gravesia rosea]UTM97445.1 Ycf1 protein [Gravesia subglobosa]
MILKSFLLGNLVSLCMKIINSVVMVGLYYGFLTTFSIGPSYLFLLQARVMEEGEEGTEKKVSATTGFIAGQLMMFISIYYAPLHLALGRPHTITVLALPYLLFHFFWNNHKHFFDYGSTTRNSMRNLSIQCVFLNNLIFQLFNHFILPSSMLARLVNIYMFRCNNKMLFVTSSFVGWLIGHIFFMKWVELVLVWIQQNNSIRSNKYLGSELRNSMDRIFSILLFITCVYYLGRIPSPILTKKMKETSETEERGQNEEERDIEIETTFETKGTKQEQEGSNEEDPSPFSEEKEDPNKIDERKEIRVNGKEKTRDEFHLKETVYKDSPVSKTSYLDGNKENSKLEVLKEDKLWFEKPLVTLLFDYKRWNRPLRYIKNNRFENAVRNEMSQYFFYTCRNDGKEKISFTYPPSLSTFREMIKRKMDLFTEEKRPPDELYDHWISTNDQKKKNLSKEFRNRIEVLKKGSITLDVLEKKSRLCNDETKKEYLPKIDDPFLNGPYRGRRNIFFSSSIRNETSIKNDIEKRWINKIQGILFTTDYDYEKLEEKIDTFDQNSLSTENQNDFFPFSKMEFKIQQGRIVFEDQINIGKFIFIQNVNPESKRLKEISKKVIRWSSKLIDDLEQQEGENEETVAEDHEIRSRKAKRVVILNDNKETNDINNKSNNNPDERDEVALIRYSQQSDFRRDIIKGSMRAQRRKTNIGSFFQANLHSPLVLERIANPLLSFDISQIQIQKFIFQKWKKGTQLELRILDYTQEKAKEKEKEKKEEYKRQKKVRIEIAEAWDNILFAQIIRGSLLVIQSFLRKYILLLSLIIVKNTVRILVFQFPEWSEDFKDWKKEMHIKCTYNGVPLSETEFPKNWLINGIQIKILFPFFFKPWYKSKVQSLQKDPRKKKNDFCFLTVWGMETDLPFGSPRKRLSFFNPIFKEMKKKIRIFLKKKFLVGFQQISELNETNKEKDRKISNQMISESSLTIPIQSMDLKDFSFTETKMKDLADRTNTIMNRIKKIQNQKYNNNEFLTNDRNSNCKKTNSLNKLLVSIRKSLKKFKKRNVRLIRKSYLRINLIIQKIYIKVFLCIIHKNSPKITTQLFELSKNEFEKLISTNEINKEKMNKTSAIHIIWTLKKRFFDITKKNSKNLSNLSYFSQAYVFYQIYKTQIYRDLLQYKETSLFLKKEIKDYFETEGILHLELGHKNLFNSTIVEWKNSLSKYYQYELSRIQWYRLVPHKWRNRVNQRSIMTENKDFQKSHSDEKDKFIFCKKLINFESNSFSNEKYTINFQKYYKYALFSYQFINYDDRKDSYISVSPLWINNSQENCSNSNIYNIKKSALVDMSERIIPIYNSIYIYFGQNKNMTLDKFPDKKYFEWKILYLCFRKKGDIHSWIAIDTNINFNNNTNTNTKVNNYPIVGKIDKKDLVYLQIDKDQKITISQKKKSLFDWMGMNEEILRRSISNLKLWFFGEFVLLYNTYKTNPWIIPVKELLFNFNETVSENKNITKNQKENPLKLSNEHKSKSIKLENKNQEKKESLGKNNVELNIQNKETLESIFSTQENDIEEDSAGSERKKRQKRKQYKSNTEAELDFVLKRYLRFQLRWNNFLNQKITNNIKVYCLLLRLVNPKEIAISSIQGGETSLDILMIQKDFTLRELMTKRILIIEPVRLSIKTDGQFLMYQTLNASLVHKSEYQLNQSYREKHYIDQNNYTNYIVRHPNQRITKNRDYGLVIPERIFSTKWRRELIIRICFNSRNRNLFLNNSVFCNNVKNYDQVLNKSQNFDRDKIELIQFKSFLWPTYRLEDLSCMNRYWFDTNNGSRFSLLRIYMYPPLKIRE